jgi:hypothetical protein
MKPYDTVVCDVPLEGLHVRDPDIGGDQTQLSSLSKVLVIGTSDKSISIDCLSLDEKLKWKKSLSAWIVNNGSTSSKISKRASFSSNFSVFKDFKDRTALENVEDIVISEEERKSNSMFDYNNTKKKIF